MTQPFMKTIKQLQEVHADIKIIERTVEEQSLAIIFLESIVETALSLSYLETSYFEFDKLPTLQWQSTDVPQVIQHLFKGEILLYLKEEDTFATLNAVHQPIKRFIDQPQNEQVVQGPLDSFTEDININIGICRNKIQTEYLETYTAVAGQTRKRKFVFLAMRNDPSIPFIKKLIKRLEKNQGEINHLNDINTAIQIPRHTLLPRISTTELPTNAVDFLQRGRIVFFMDGYPFALMLFKTVFDTFKQPNDLNYPTFLYHAIYGIRILGILIALLLPGLYVALVTVNPEMMKIELALTIMESRLFVPYPAFVEITIMLILIELITEASVRLPSSIASTLGIVGGIILGQAVVEAQLVSSILIIIIAATTIATGTVVGFQHSVSLRFFKYLLIATSAFIGMLGLLIGLLLVCAYLGRTETFGVPFIRFEKEGVKIED
ncbi:spore germination protein [Cytobacillus purgationiresistens]|uniref:Uncharacterized protein YebE (UPF0316 family) n=1 Tax=Cytobacillus purgationiresistens TaxID=863449 RepID=A0ABU0AKQ7_9BACI|nr:spore germination protein [Cytobacillus purgationiresistens]MDQ0271846.1 uncharacterized protein YebE (UPF0316 family) [Cytobacillus purgationiresistens]